MPFAISFDAAGHLVIAEAGTNALATFALSPAGIGHPARRGRHRPGRDLLGGPGTAACSSPPTPAARTSPRTPRQAGQLTLLGQTSTDPGTVDASASPSGRYLYVQTGGNGVVDEFAVGAGGALTAVGSVTVPGAVGGEGIVAA